MRHNIFDYSLHTSIVGVTVWHLGSLNYILVSSPCFPYLFPVTLVSCYCAYLAVYILFYLALCYMVLPVKYLHSILLQLPFGQLDFAAHPCFPEQFLYLSAAIHT